MLLLPLICLSLYDPFSGVETLTRSNYKMWRQDIERALGLIDLICVYLEGKSTVTDDDVSDGTKAKLEKCEFEGYEEDYLRDHLLVVPHLLTMLDQRFVVQVL